MSWINTIPFEKATGKLRKIYERVSGPDNNVDNILMAHSLRPHSLEGHMALYKNVLHHTGNTFSKAYLEVIGVYVSLLNQCHYCIDHHFQGLIQQIKDEEKASLMRHALESEEFEPIFSKKEIAGLLYSKKLTLSPFKITLADMEICRKSGLDDGEILEINQVAAYFNYANRTVLGLGVSTEGDVLGLSPNNSSDSKDWSHSSIKD